MARLSRLFLVVTFVVALAIPTKEASAFTTEEKFQDIFITAGYATAFGAALGAALLGFERHPEQNLRYVAVGASLGFISGSALGTYMVLSPSFVMNTDSPPDLLLADHQPRSIALRPILRSGSGQFDGLAGVFSFQF